MRVTVKKVVEKDTDRVLFSGVDERGKKFTFRLSRRPVNPIIEHIIREIESGQELNFDLPTPQ